MADRVAELVRTEITEDALLLVIERPPANPLALDLVAALEAALDVADREAGNRIVIVRSALPGFFVAGADIKHMVELDEAGFRAYGDSLRSAFDRLAAPERISIAAVDGLALGGGCELAMACTLRVAGPDARFGLPEVKIGLLPGAGGTQRLPALVGRGRALEMMLTGRQVDAAEAHAIGLVDRLAPGDATVTALELARELRANSRVALESLVRSVDAGGIASAAAGHRVAADEVTELFARGDAQEGLQAFLERREPRFGR
ncbi:MAG TPA: enoyl-CoA hydratase-related protein [Solirubrobacterales bacterium]|jgi:enoyl-CoA hydratase|nr:enoyl-CoA hydratase-related protein [Solirubrobacterales bacterium]